MKLFIIIPIVLTILIAVFLYFAWIPSSQVFGKVIYKIDSNVLLTFDDGPAKDTPAILDILKENNVSAVFFVTGNQAKKHPETLMRIKNEGHMIACHTMTHPHLIKNNEEEILGCKNLIENMANATLTLFRPPYGFRTPVTIHTAKKHNMNVMTWSVFSKDYKSKKNDIVKRVLKSVKEGSIICCHDGPANRNETVMALQSIIDGVKEKGLAFADPFEVKLN